MERIFCLALGYVIGLLQTAYIVGRLLQGIDIRDHGSKSAGTTNVVRVMGTKAGLLVFICDVLKGVAGYLICRTLFPTFPFAALWGGVGVILGHCFPFYLKFKGGKGVASTLGIILLTDIKIALILFAIGIIIVIFTKYISAASLAITLLFPFALYLFKYPGEMVFLGFLITVLSWYLHRANIKRLAGGVENKFTFRKQ